MGAIDHMDEVVQPMELMDRILLSNHGSSEFF